MMRSLMTSVGAGHGINPSPHMEMQMKFQILTS